MGDIRLVQVRKLNVPAVPRTEINAVFPVTCEDRIRRLS